MVDAIARRVITKWSDLYQGQVTFNISKDLFLFSDTSRILQSKATHVHRLKRASMWMGGESFLWAVSAATCHDKAFT